MVNKVLNFSMTHTCISTCLWQRKGRNLNLFEQIESTAVCQTKNSVQINFRVYVKTGDGPNYPLPAAGSNLFQLLQKIPLNFQDTLYTRTAGLFFSSFAFGSFIFYDHFIEPRTMTTEKETIVHIYTLLNRTRLPQRINPFYMGNLSGRLYL